MTGSFEMWPGMGLFWTVPLDLSWIGPVLFGPLLQVKLIPLEVVIGNEFLTIVLSAGAAAMLTAIVQSYRSLREGSKADEKDAFITLDEQRTSESHRRERAEVERDYWHRRAATLEYELITKLGPSALPEAEPWPQENDTDHE